MMGNPKARAEYYRDIHAHLRPRRRRLLQEKEPQRSAIATKVQADRIEDTLAAFHRRVKSRKKMQLSELFAENISLFCRLNRQKSAYEQLFSKSRENKENRGERRRLKRCTSAHVPRLRTFEEPSREASRVRRPCSSHSGKPRRLLTVHSEC